MPTPGYSGRALADKLGIKAGHAVFPVGAPDDWAALVGPLPTDIRIAKRAAATVDLVHLFATSRADLTRRLAALRDTLRPDAVVWVSWPKKSAGVATDLTENVIRDVALPMGWVDVKVCAVSDVWSGLKLVVRKTLR